MGGLAVVPLQSLSCSASFPLAFRHSVSKYGTNTNSSRVGGLCCCCRRGATVACRPQICTPPAAILSRQRLTWTSTATGVRKKSLMLNLGLKFSFTCPRGRKDPYANVFGTKLDPCFMYPMYVPYCMLRHENALFKKVNMFPIRPNVIYKGYNDIKGSHTPCFPSVYLQTISV